MHNKTMPTEQNGFIGSHGTAVVVMPDNDKEFSGIIQHNGKTNGHMHTITNGTFVGNETHQAMVDSNETVTLTWRNVNVYVNPPKRACCRGPDPNVSPKQVLQNVSGIAKPGTLLAIIGASGSGKTTLLNTLTTRQMSDALTTSGDVRVNGVNVKKGIRNISAYVTQDDLFIATMTVREHLRFRALLRMEKEVSQSKRLQRVEELIKEIGLTKCADNIIGNPGRIKGISGGEMRRLSFASEFLTNPPLLFCDEPTSGLDSFMADNIIQILKTMADRGKTVLCTIHQPSSEVFAKFHHVLIMAEGRVAFMGTADEAVKFYTSSGYACPSNFNPADFYIMTMAIIPGNEKDSRAKVESICDSFKNSTMSKDIEAEIDRISQNPYKEGLIYEEATSTTSRYEASSVQQFSTLFIRAWRTAVREPMVIRIRFAQTVLIALMLGLIYLQLEVNQTGVMNINGLLFLTLTNSSFSNVIGVLNTFPLETPIFMREYGIGLYKVHLYFITKMLAELPSFLIIPFIFACIVYWMVGLYASAEAFFTFAAILILVSNVAISFGYIISTAVNSVTAALAIAAPVMIPLLMFGGFFLNSDSIPKYFIWLEHLSWFKYSNELIAINQWDRVDTIACSAGNLTCAQGCLFSTGQEVIKYLNFEKGRNDSNIGALFALLIGFRVVAFLILLLKARLSRN